MPTRRTFLKTTAAGAAGLHFAHWHTMPLSAGSGDRPIDLRYRQVHLDFHTSQHIAGVGKEFDPALFAATLARAHVNSVTCFARCHHGYIYYDTRAFPERKHPQLTRNLLREQIDACHARDIRVPIYVTVQWDKFTVDTQPGWRQVSRRKGTRQGNKCGCSSHP